MDDDDIIIIDDPVYATVNIGDYQYTIDSEYSEGASVRVIDTTKSSYADMPSTITYNGNSYSVKYLYNSFMDCTNMETAPTLSSNAGAMSGCFYGCTSLTAPPTIPASVGMLDWCFYGCMSLTSAPTIPSGVTNMYECFTGCTSLTSATTIPSGVTNMYECFKGCVSLTSAPAIPSAVKSMWGCFSGCTSLSGNITVANNPTSYRGIFDNTVSDIYILPSSLSTEAVNTWKAIANEYGNVHYSDDAAILAITTLSATRTANNSTTQSEAGTYAHLVATYQSGGRIPDGYTQTITWTLTTIVGNSSSTSTDSWSTVTTGSKEIWVSQPVNTTATYQLTLSDNFGKSATLSVTLSKGEALLDFHAGGDGLAIGTFSTGPGFEIAMATNFDEAVKSYNRPWYPCFVYSAFPTDANSAKDESQLPVTPCFVLDTSDNAFYFCDGT